MDVKKDAHDNINPLVNDLTDNPMHDLDSTGARVKDKWRGTPEDKLDMKTLGRNQVLRVRR